MVPLRVRWVTYVLLLSAGSGCSISGDGLVMTAPDGNNGGVTEDGPRKLDQAGGEGGFGGSAPIDARWDAETDAPVTQPRTDAIADATPADVSRLDATPDRTADLRPDLAADLSPDVSPDAADLVIGPPTPGTVACGSATCSVQTSYCCAQLVGSANPVCQPNGQSCATGQSRRCDGPEDCDSDEICCGRLHDGQIRISCMDAEACDNGAPLCRDFNDCRQISGTYKACCPYANKGTTIGLCRFNSACSN